MIAAENGNLEVVKCLLKNKFDVFYEIAGKIAIDEVKMDESYDAIVLSLLEADSRFPKIFDKNQVTSEELKRFVEEMRAFHDLISDGESHLEEIAEFIENHKNLRYFFVPDHSGNLNNVSAYKRAENGNFKPILELLRRKAIIKARFEIKRRKLIKLTKYFTKKSRDNEESLQMVKIDDHRASCTSSSNGFNGNPHSSSSNLEDHASNNEPSEDPPNAKENCFRRFLNFLRYFFSSRHRSCVRVRNFAAAAVSRAANFSTNAVARLMPPMRSYWKA